MEQPNLASQLIPSLDILFCGISNNPEFVNKSHEEITKVRLCDLHPEQPWVLSADKLEISIWDYFGKKRLMCKSLQNIYTSSIKNINNNSNHDTKNRIDKSKRNISKRYSSSNNKKMQSIWNINDLSSNLQNDEGFASLSSSDTIDNHNHKSFHLGEIRRLSFCDNLTLNYLHDCIILPDTLTSNSKIMLVCENAVIFYDFITDISSCLTINELSKYPTYAEFITYNIVAIGFHDGSILIWNIDSWMEIKVLNSHSKGDIVLLKILPTLSLNKDTDCYNRQSQLNTNESALNRIRMLSMGHDGYTHIWEIYSIIDINKEANPIASLHTSISSTTLASCSHIDEINNILITVSDDRSIKMWELDSLGAKKTNKNKNSVKRGFFSRGTVDNDDDLVCIGKIKLNSSSSLSAAYSKYTSCVPLTNPRFPSGAYILCAKTNTIAIAQTLSVGTDEERSELSSVNSEVNEKSVSLQVNHEISIANLMESYINNYFDKSMEESLPLLVNSIKESNIRVYNVQTHPRLHHIISLGTTIGIIIINLSPISIGPTIGNHPSWGSYILTYQYPQRVIQRQSIEFNSNGVNNEDNSVTNTDNDISNDGVRLEVLDEIDADVDLDQIITNSVRKSRLMSNNNNSSSIGSSLSSLKTKSLPYKNSHCRPVFYTSPSGRFCTVWFSDTLTYIILSISNTDIKENCEMKEIERGSCTSFAWLGIGVGCFDMYSFITPTTKKYEEKKKARRRSSISFSLFRSKEEEFTFIQPELIFKCVLPNLLTTCKVNMNVKNTTLVNNHMVKEIFGGLLLCANVPYDKTVKSNLGDDYQQFEHGKISRNNMKSLFYYAIPSDISTSITLSNLTNSTVNTPQISQLKQPTTIIESPYEDLDSSIDNSTHSDSNNIEIEKIEELNFTLHEVEPAMSGVNSITWDYLSGYAAILIGNHINIIRILEDLDQNDKDKRIVNLITISSIAIFDYAWSYPSSIWWSNGCLFTSSGNKTSMICTEFPYENKINERKQNYPKLSFKDPEIDIITISNNSKVIIFHI
jgi:hypothetical protein